MSIPTFQSQRLHKITESVFFYLTMKKNKLQWYDDLTLEYFYKSISNYQEHIRLPHHDVVYVRAAIAGATGKTFTYEQVYTAMKAEGWNKD